MDDFISRIVTEVQETEEDFIFTTIQPFCEGVIKRKISKAELINYLTAWERKGRWIGHIIGRNGERSIDRDVCSACGSRFYQLAETGQLWRYCPNCGAKMERSADDET